jgi:hypothetical protein
MAPLLQCLWNNNLFESRNVIHVCFGGLIHVYDDTFHGFIC